MSKKVIRPNPNVWRPLVGQHSHRQHPIVFPLSKLAVYLPFSISTHLRTKRPPTTFLNYQGNGWKIVFHVPFNLLNVSPRMYESLKCGKKYAHDTYIIVAFFHYNNIILYFIFPNFSVVSIVVLK